MFFGSGKLYGGTAKSRKTSTYAIPIVARIQSFMKLNARLKAFLFIAYYIFTILKDSDILSLVWRCSYV